MALKRSRPATEIRFQNAVLELVAESGFAQLGVNLVAERAGSDKVLIYRYFGSFDGLLQSLATSRSWLPSAHALCSALPDSPVRLLDELALKVSRHVRSDPTSHQIALWRHATKNPLTEAYSQEWKQLWREIPKQIGAKLSYEDRKNWEAACALLSLIVQAELADGSLDSPSLQLICDQLVTPYGIAADEEELDDPYALPTNLL
ncbi:MAG: TetR/AcrR family transcriptional regulator [Opitutales bacterium]